MKSHNKREKRKKRGGGQAFNSIKKRACTLCRCHFYKVFKHIGHGDVEYQMVLFDWKTPQITAARGQQDSWLLNHSSWRFISYNQIPQSGNCIALWENCRQQHFMITDSVGVSQCTRDNTVLEDKNEVVRYIWCAVVKMFSTAKTFNPKHPPHLTKQHTEAPIDANISDPSTAKAHVCSMLDTQTVRWSLPAVL